METADSVTVTILVDSYINGFLPSTQWVKRSRLDAVMGTGKPMLAEFGFSAVVSITKGKETYTLLFDTGVGKQALLSNAQALRINIKQVETIVLSHGHPDHTASIVESVCAIGKKDLSVVAHPEARIRAAAVLPNQPRFEFPYYLDEEAIKQCGARLEWCDRPTALASASAYVTGQVPRITDFEKGAPPNSHYRVKQGDLVHDPDIFDDQALVINVNDKGLIVLTGCAHSGLINTLKYAQEISGVKPIHGVIGGFHLTGNFYDPIIDQTVRALKEFAPKAIIPAHCTGMKAVIKIANSFPDAFVETSVGSTFEF